MKKLIVNFTGLCLLTVALMISSCSKTGDTGPAGAAGPAGPAGPTGANGAAGAPGTANVIYSAWLDATFADSNGVAEILAPQLTADIINSGSIKVYWNLGDASDPFVVALPAVVSPLLLFNPDDLPANPASIFVDAYFQTGSILLVSNYPISSSNGVSQFRYVLIPGGEPAGGRSAVNWKDYKSVQKYLGLKD
jgi:hypothetical protein